MPAPPYKDKTMADEPHRELIFDMACEMCRDESARRFAETCGCREIDCVAREVYGDLAERLYRMVQEEDNGR